MAPYPTLCFLCNVVLECTNDLNLITRRCTLSESKSATSDFVLTDQPINVNSLRVFGRNYINDILS